MKPIEGIANASEYHLATGRVICFCQCVEADLKKILSHRAAEAGVELPSESSTWTLGQSVIELENIDMGMEKPFFSRSDYAFLKKVTHIRNHYAHHCYLDWVHEEGSARKGAFDQSAAKLVEDHNHLMVLFELMERIASKF